VAEVAVVGVPADGEAGEDEVMAFVVAVPGTRPTPEKLWSWCDARLPNFAVPRYLALVDELPKTPSEKVRKVELREMAATIDRSDRES
jgi:crotonobetaine/carnitine-CoA ligase